MADHISGQALQRVYSITFELVRKRIVANIEDGDVALSQLKDRLITEFEEVNRKLDKILDLPLKAAQTNMQRALTSLHCKDEEDAKRYFHLCSDKAVEAFHSSESFSDKATATRLQIMCVLYLNGYFHGECKMESIRNHCRDAVNRLLSDAAVRSAIRDEFEKSVFSFVSRMVSGAGRREIFCELSGLFHFLVESIDLHCDISTSTGSIVSLSGVAPALKRGHMQGVGALLFHEGRFISGGDIIIVWDTFMNEIGRMKGHKFYTNSLTAVGNRLYSGSETIKVWDLTTFAEILSFQIEGVPVSSLVIQRDRLYAGHLSSQISVWNLSTLNDIISMTDMKARSLALTSYKAMALLEGHTGKVTCLAVTAATLISGSDDKTIKVWDLTTQQDVTTLRSHTDDVRCLVVVGERLFSCSSDKTIKVWDLKTYALLTSLSGHTEAVLSLAVYRNKLYSGSSDKSIRVWDLSTFGQVQSFSSSHWVRRMTISGGTLVAGLGEGSLETYYL